MKIAEILKGKVHTVRVAIECQARYFDLLSSVPCTWSSEEDLFILKKYCEIGRNWLEISKCLYERNESQVKCRFKSLLKRAGIQQISDLIEFKEKEAAFTFSREYIEQNCVKSDPDAAFKRLIR